MIDSWSWGGCGGGEGRTQGSLQAVGFQDGDSRLASVLPQVPITPDSADFLSSQGHPGFPFPSPLPLVCFSGPTTPRLRREAKAKQTRPPGEGNSSRGTGAEGAERPRMRGLSQPTSGS